MHRPAFMTAAMWFVWLLRTDVREGSAVGDTEAQRNFVSWWLLFGKIEYPKVWWYGQKQVKVAMEPCAGNYAIPIPRLLLRLYRARGELQASFDLHHPESAALFFCWYRLTGPLELPAAPALPGYALAVTEEGSGKPLLSGIPRMALALWARSEALKSVIDPTLPGPARGLCAWYQAHRAKVIPRATDLPDWKVVEPTASSFSAIRRRLSKVNLIGFARSEFGVGEDVRALSRALDWAGVDHGVLEVLPDGPVRRSDRSRLPIITKLDNEACINIFCVTAFDMAHIFLREGPDLFETGYNVGYWPWELPEFPEQWQDTYRLVHEVWAATRFQQSSYRHNSPVAVHYMPPVATVSGIRPPPRRLAGARLVGKFCFIHPFDPNSTLARKNPLASVRAFRMAFPRHDDSVRLILRVNGQGRGKPGWRALRAAMAGDARIRVIEGTLSREEAQRVLRQADCLLSPHRAEGLGRNITEAIALGVPVLATGFSGACDFLRDGERISFKLRRLKPAEYPFADGQVWAEPNIRRLRDLMQRARRHVPCLRPTARWRRARHLEAEFGVRPAGLRYAAALRRIETTLLKKRSRRSAGQPFARPGSEHSAAPP